MTQTLVVYGGKGMGKTNFGAVFAEELYAAGHRFAVIDPMGVWWGLQHGRDRATPGLEVLILGGVHGDLPIEPSAGAIAADLVADEQVSVVIDVSRRANGTMWTQGERIRFVRDYALRLYQRQGERRRPVMQILDEAARFVPQQPRTNDHDVMRCLGAIEVICEEGRNIGLGLCLLTQRSARLNKSVAELADVMIAFRTVGPNSIGAILDWFGEHIPKARHAELVEQVRKLPIGHALVVSPGWLQFEGDVHIRLRDTFDSSATPTGKHDLRAPGAAKKPDLDRYRDRLREVVERAEADDPRKLQAKVLKLERELRDAETAAKTSPAPPTVERVEVPTPIPLLSDDDSALLAGAVATLERLVSAAQEVAGEAGAGVQAIKARLEAAEARQDRAGRELAARRATAEADAVPPPPSPQRPVRALTAALDALASGGNGGAFIHGGVEQRILDALAELERMGFRDPTRTLVAFFAGYTNPKSGGFAEPISRLIADGMIGMPGTGKLALTASGKDKAAPPTRATTAHAMQERILALLDGPQAKTPELFLAGRRS